MRSVGLGLLTPVCLRLALLDAPDLSSTWGFLSRLRLAAFGQPKGAVFQFVLAARKEAVQVFVRHQLWLGEIQAPSATASAQAVLLGNEEAELAAGKGAAFFSHRCIPAGQYQPA
jgi:hypothetical protein